MFRAIPTNDPTAVEGEVQRVYLEVARRGSPLFVPQVFGWAIDCFTGYYPGYQAIDARYHDFEHTLQGTLCMVRLLQGRHQAGAEPVLSGRMFELGLLAILFHDTGYLKQAGDQEGTGAKYTLVHVNRSAEFAGAYLRQKGFSEGETRAVQNMIRCTGVNVDLGRIPFHDPTERIVGYALGTADLLGQMAAADYVEKLPILYSEFAEASQFEKGKKTHLSGFGGAEDLMRKTPYFWDNYVLPKIKDEFRQLYRFLARPYPEGPNDYLDRVQENMDRLRHQFTNQTHPAISEE